MNYAKMENEERRQYTKLSPLDYTFFHRLCETSFTTSLFDPHLLIYSNNTWNYFHKYIDVLKHLRYHILVLKLTSNTKMIQIDDNCPLKKAFFISSFQHFSWLNFRPTRRRNKDSHPPTSDRLRQVIIIFFFFQKWRSATVQDS